MDLLTAMEVFKRPFEARAMTWKPQATTSDNSKVMAAPYADVRAYEDRLNEVTPLDWQSRAEFLHVDMKLVCTVHLTVFDVTRTGDGEAPVTDQNAATVAYAQAFKRACSRFGLGRYLYDLPAPWVKAEKRGRSVVIPKGEIGNLRQRYAAWLKRHQQGQQLSEAAEKMTERGSGDLIEGAEEVDPGDDEQEPEPQGNGTPDWLRTETWYGFAESIVSNMDEFSAVAHVTNTLKAEIGDDYTPWTEWAPDTAEKCYNTLKQHLANK